ncbi:MAG: hypothetical protein D3923_02090 [Candidatus Electrothrix sp. AR3]|nr:hypothetical protein [Candidatus Electrothrix sp. AR3]
MNTLSVKIIFLVCFCIMAASNAGALELKMNSADANSSQPTADLSELDSVMDYFMVRHQGIMKQKQQSLLMRDQVREIMLKRLPLQKEMTNLFAPVMNKSIMDVIKKQKVEFMQNFDIKLPQEYKK